jgi:hypothetical protein
VRYCLAKVWLKLAVVDVRMWMAMAWIRTRMAW